MHAPGLRSILSSDNSNSATDIDESSIRTGIINQAATYVRRLLPSSNEKSGYWLTPSSRVIFLVVAITLRSADQNVFWNTNL